MPRNMYADVAGSAAPNEPAPGESDSSSTDTEKKEDRDEGQKTFTLPKEALAGKEFKPGEEVVFEIVAIHDDSVEVKYAKEKPDEDEAPPEEESSPQIPAAAGGGEGGMASMYS